MKFILKQFIYIILLCFVFSLALFIFKSWLFAKTDASEGNPFEKYLYGWHSRTSSFHFEFYVYIIKTKCI